MEQPHTVIRLPDDPYATSFQGRRTGRGRGVLTLAAVTVVVAAIIAIASSSSKKHPQSGTSGGTAGVGGGVSAPPGQTTLPAGSVTQQVGDTQFPASSLNGAMIGYKDTQAGAEAAAANYVAAYNSEAMLHPTQRRALIKTIADPAVEPNLQTQLDSGITVVQTGQGLDKNGNPPAGQSLVCRAFIAGVHTVSYDASKATIAVWVDSLLGNSGKGSTHPVVESWNTVTVSLVWVNGDWKWHSTTEVEGPTPVSTQVPSTAEVLQSAVSQFKGLRYAP